MRRKLVSEEEIRNRWIAAILSFDWSKEKDQQKNINNNFKSNNNLNKKGEITWNH